MQGEGRATSKKNRRPGQVVAYVLWGGWPWQHSFVVPRSSLLDHTYLWSWSQWWWRGLPGKLGERKTWCIHHSEIEVLLFLPPVWQLPALIVMDWGWKHIWVPFLVIPPWALHSLQCFHFTLFTPSSYLLMAKKLRKQILALDKAFHIILGLVEPGTQNASLAEKRSEQLSCHRGVPFLWWSCNAGWRMRSFPASLLSMSLVSLPWIFFLLVNYPLSFPTLDFL